MKDRKFKIRQSEYDKVMGNAFRLGRQQGQQEERNRRWVGRGEPQTLVDRQIQELLESSRGEGV